MYRPVTHALFKHAIFHPSWVVQGFRAGPVPLTWPPIPPPLYPTNIHIHGIGGA